MNKNVIISYVFFDTDDKLIEYPITIYKGRIVDIKMQNNPSTGKANVDILIGGPFDDFDKKSGRKTNTESQKEYFPNDLGLEYAIESDSELLKWGS